MWFAKTHLVPTSELTQDQRLLAAPAWQLHDRENAVREFAMGDASIDLSEFTDSEARFIDIYGTVRKFRPEFRPEHILGIDPEGLVITDGEGRGFWDTFVSTYWLTKPATPRRPERHIVWTLTWHFTPDKEWILVGSHATAAETQAASRSSIVR